MDRGSQQVVNSCRVSTNHFCQLVTCPFFCPCPSTHFGPIFHSAADLKLHRKAEANLNYKTVTKPSVAFKQLPVRSLFKLIPGTGASYTIGKLISAS